MLYKCCFPVGLLLPTRKAYEEPVEILYYDMFPVFLLMYSSVALADFNFLVCVLFLRVLSITSEVFIMKATAFLKKNWYFC
jgi:hypothetical protein